MDAHVSATQMPSFFEGFSYLEKPTAKITLLAVGVVGAIGAVLCYFYGLNTLSTAVCCAISVLSLAVVLVAYCRSSSTTARENECRIADPDKLSPGEERRLTEEKEWAEIREAKKREEEARLHKENQIKEMKERVERITIEELIQALPLANPEAGSEGEWVKKTLSAKLRKEYKIFPQETAANVAERLKPQIEACKNSAQFKIFIKMFLACASEPLSFTTQVLDELFLPHEFIPDLPEIVVSACCSQSEWRTENASYPLFELDLSKLAGEVNLMKSSFVFSNNLQDYLSKGFKTVLNKAVGNGQKVAISISQKLCTSRAKDVLPILGIFKDLPGLAVLELSHLGNLSSPEGSFSDEESKELLEIVTTCPDLIKARFDTRGMSVEGRKQFLEEVKQITRERKRRLSAS